MAWLDSLGKMHWLHDDEHWKLAEEVLREKLHIGLKDYIGGANRTLMFIDDWIKISNYRDFSMREYDEDRHFDFEAQDPEDGWDFYDRQLAKLAEYIVDCVIYNNDDPSEPIINIVYMGYSDFDDVRVTMTPHDVVEKFGGPKHGKRLLDKMYDGLMDRMSKRNPRRRNPTSSLGSIAIAGLAGYLLSKK